ncbi:MAG: SCP2 sterol-binding domain-containing protein [Pseudomonadota bacterium]|nr:SCP2 sterol-binding domain-containing protein [Pseudomonadota bacterium]
MQTAVITRLSSPVFPRPLSLPFVLLPNAVHSRTVVTVLNRVFASDLREGELDYLQDRSVRFHIQDMQLTFSITLQQGRLAAFLSENKPDLSITGTLHAFLLLATRREDTDTLFFQRRLRMEGDTELGLEVKNFLDGVDVESLWLSRQLETMLQRALSLYERVLG